MDNFIVSKTTLERTIQYLMRQPYGDVAQLIVELSKAKPLQAPMVPIETAKPAPTIRENSSEQRPNGGSSS